jgi:hypothetical protein
MQAWRVVYFMCGKLARRRLPEAGYGNPLSSFLGTRAGSGKLAWSRTSLKQPITTPVKFVLSYTAVPLVAIVAVAT